MMSDLSQLAVSGGWVGSSAHSETGQRWMSTAGPTLGVGVPFWMSQLTGKSPVNMETGTCTGGAVYSQTSWDSGAIDYTRSTVDASRTISLRVYGATWGSHNNGHPAGYVYFRVILSRADTGATLYDNTLIDRWTSGDGSSGIGNWSWSSVISNLTGYSGATHVRIIRRMISGYYDAHIDGTQKKIWRIMGIQTWI